MLRVAYDSMTIFVSLQNSWIDSITLQEHKRIWEPSAQEKLLASLKQKVTIVIGSNNRQQATMVSNYMAFTFPGKLVEFDRTDSIFTNQSSKLTEEYVTGRFA